ncbi:hypothetical protein Patl1_12142 [Pistacia atlantica]|uniref:Uncharacterized protein n=1 Tax=Pistacia atlantica TaxID=434234 RepID=A0ACC1A2W8_9ROSI|nr:hypothetical protein Patl1_12142 [Pistacia atlantica]
MAEVVTKFFIASMFMSIAPLAILFGFNHNLLPGKIILSNYLLLYYVFYFYFFRIILVI